MARRRKPSDDTETSAPDPDAAAEPSEPRVLGPAIAGLHPRADAGLRAPIRPPARLWHRQGLVVHCTGGHRPERPEDVPRILRALQAYHQGAKRWSDAGYHWAIDPWGHVWQLRGWGIRGAHAKTGGHNFDSHGLVVLGSGEEMTDAERAALLWLVADADRRFGPQWVRGHNEIPGVRKACPGPVVSAFVRSLGRG